METLVGVYEKDAQLSGPACDKGARVTARVAVVKGDNSLPIRLHAEISNACLLDDIDARVSVTFLNGGVEQTRLILDLPKVPRKGLPWNSNTRRGAEKEEILSGNFSFNEVKFEFENIANQSVIAETLKLAVVIAILW